MLPGAGRVLCLGCTRKLKTKCEWQKLFEATSNILLLHRRPQPGVDIGSVIARYSQVLWWLDSADEDPPTECFLCLCANTKQFVRKSLNLVWGIFLLTFLRFHNTFSSIKGETDPSYCGQCRMCVRLNELALPIQAKNKKKKADFKKVRKGSARLRCTNKQAMLK